MGSLSSWNEYSFQDGTPYNGAECPEGYYGSVATMTLIPYGKRDETTVFKFRIRFKSIPTPQRLQAHKDLFTLIEGAQLSNEKDLFDFRGTNKDADNEWDRFSQMGYDIQDIYNLGEYYDDNTKSRK